MKFNVYFFFLNVFLLISFIYIYLDYSEDIINFNQIIDNDLNSFEEVIENIHNEDVLLYRTLLSNDLKKFSSFEESFEINNNKTNFIINLFKISNENKALSNKLDSSLKSYFELEKSKSKILELHKLNLISSIDNYDEQLSLLLIEYENSVSKTMDEFKDNLDFIKKERKEFQNKIKINLFSKIFVILLIYILSIYLLLYKNNLLISNSNNQIYLNHHNSHLKKEKEIFNENFLDNESKLILKFLKHEISSGFYPTIKDVKKELDLTHPTILSRLKKLEEKNLIGIKKNGRNKNIYLK